MKHSPDGKRHIGMRCVAALGLFFLGVAFGQRPPVVLIDGYHLLCQSADLVSNKSFGDLEQRLRSQGVSVRYLPTCSLSGKPSIEDIANALTLTIRDLNVPEVDMVTHSMGGLVVRSYLSGKQSTSGVFRPPKDPLIRKWVSVATPNYGALIPSVFADILPDTQARELVPGSQFLFDLATWNQNHDDLRGVDTVGIVGNAGGFGPFEGGSDGTVAVTSASMSFAEPDQHTRVLPYCHGASIFNSILGFGCDAPPLARIQSENPLSWLIIDSFLSGTNDWKTAGHAPSEDPYLSQYGGVLSQNRDNMDLATGPISDQNFVKGPVVGTYAVQISKPGPQISLVAPSAARLSLLSLAPRMLISIYGNNLSGSSVSVNGQVLTLTYLSDRQINTLLPENVTGLAKLTVSNSQGKAVVNIMIDDAVPAVFTMDGSGQGPAAAIRVGNYVELFLTGLGVGDQVPTVLLNEVPARVTYAGPAPGFQGLDQINIELPADAKSGAITVKVGRHASNIVTI